MNTSDCLVSPLCGSFLARVVVFVSVFFPYPVFAVCSSLYGGSDPLHPSPSSPMGEYLNITQASTIERAFEQEHNGPVGDPRLVVNVSFDSYPEFESRFVNDSILYLFHDPNSRILNAAFNGNKGFMARLNFLMEFTFSGAMLIPICLTETESQRLRDYLRLAENVDRAFDVALFPWLLEDSAGNPYMAPGNSNSLSEWFLRMPLGEDLDQSQALFQYLMPNIAPGLQSLLQQIWSVPYAHRSLRQVLNLRPFRQGRELDTPGLIASALLASAPSDRIPAVFRFVDDHRQPLAPDFNNWFDVDFNPSSEPEMWEAYINYEI